jgi:hypothetical protein
MIVRRSRWACSTVGLYPRRSIQKLEYWLPGGPCAVGSTQLAETLLDAPLPPSAAWPRQFELVTESGTRTASAERPDQVPSHAADRTVTRPGTWAAVDAPAGPTTARTDPPARVSVATGMHHFRGIVLFATWQPLRWFGELRALHSP